MPPSPPLTPALYRWADRFVCASPERPDLVLKERMLVLCSTALALSAVGFGFHSMDLEGGVGPITTVLWFGSVLGVVNVLLLRRLGSAVVPGTMLCVEFSLLVGTVAWFGNGFGAPSIAWTLPIPLLAAFLVGPSTALAVAALTVGWLGALFVLDYAGLTPPAPFGPDEVVWLRLIAFTAAIAFSTLVAWLYESQTIEGLRRANRDLAAARDRAEASERLQSSLLLNMSHEVRTPLTGILGASDLLREEAPPDLADLAGVVHSGGRRMLATLTAVLDLAHLDHGRADVRCEPVDVASAVREAAAACAAAAARKGLSVEVAPAPAVVAAADPAMVRRVLDVVLDNAVKFTEAGGVTVRIEAEGDDACVHVTDTGPGMCPDFLPRAFEPFEQASEGMARTHEGSGLGLAVARRMAALQGGSLTAESRPGAGSTFTLRVPLAEPAAPALCLIPAA